MSSGMSASGGNPRICETGFTLILPAPSDRSANLRDIVFFSYIPSKGKIDLAVVSLREMLDSIKKYDKKCRKLLNVLRDLPNRIVYGLLESYFGVSRGYLDLGTTISRVDIPSLCEMLYELREIVKNNICDELEKCRRAIPQSTKLLLYHTALGCNSRIPNPRLIAFSYALYHPSGQEKKLTLVFPVGSLADVTGSTAGTPEICLQCKGVTGTCAYTNIPVLYCNPDSDTHFVFIAYPLCELNNVSIPQCDLLQGNPKCPIVYMAERVAGSRGGNIQALYMCRKHVLSNSVEPRLAWSNCEQHICRGVFQGFIKCNDVYENEIRTEPLLFKQQYRSISTVVRLGHDKSAGISVTVDRVNIAYVLNRFKLQVSNEDFGFKLPKSIYATVRDTFALIFSLSGNAVENLALGLAALGPRSLPLKTLAVKIAVVALHEDSRIYYSVRNVARRAATGIGGVSSLAGIVRWCLSVFQKAAKRSFYYSFRPGLTGLGFFASLLLDSITRGVTLQLLDEISRAIASKPRALAPYIVNSLAALLTSAIINMYDLPEEMVSTFVLYDSTSDRYDIIVYEDRDGGYGFLPSLTLGELGKALATISQLISTKSHSQVLSMKARNMHSSLRPINNCDANIMNMLDSVSSDLIAWAGSQLGLTIVPAWLIKVGISYSMVKAGPCKNMKSDVIRAAMQLVTERAAAYFDTDFHDTMFTVLGENIRIDMNENGERLLTTNYVAPLAIRLIQSLKP